MSFVGTVQIVSQIHHQGVDTLFHVTGNDADSLQPIIVHRELLEKASGFFKNAFNSEQWKEKEEPRIQLSHSLVLPVALHAPKGYPLCIAPK